MAFWDKNEPVILKRDSSADAQLAALESLRGTLPPKDNARLESNIKALGSGNRKLQSVSLHRMTVMAPGDH